MFPAKVKSFQLRITPNFHAYQPGVTPLTTHENTRIRRLKVAN